MRIAVTLTQPWSDYGVGKELNLPDHLAHRLIEAGMARPTKKKAERAVPPPPENTALETAAQATPQPPRKRRRKK